MRAEAAARPPILSRLGGGVLLLIAGLGCGGVMAMAPDIAAAILVLQIPGILALVVDPTPGRAIGRTILLFQAAASVRPIIGLWFQCEGVNACVAMATDKSTILTDLLAAGCGFLLTQSLPMMLKIIDDGRIKARRAKLVAEREKLVAEWELGR